MRKWSLTALGVVLVIGFIYFRALASVEELGEFVPAAPAGASGTFVAEPELASVVTLPPVEPERMPLAAEEHALARADAQEEALTAATITGLVRDPHGRPVRAFVRYVWNDRGRFRDANAWSGKDGRFVLELPRADTTGDLLASVYQHEWSPTAKLGVTAGSQDLELTLGPPSFFEVVLRDREGAPIPSPWFHFYWELAGFRVQDYPGPRGDHAKRWATSPVPFWISAQSYAARGEPWHGPFDPRDVGARLVLEMERLPVVRGRVLRAGAPIAGAWVELEPLSDASSEALGVALSPHGPNGRTDAEGRFEIHALARGRHGPVAFHDKHGSGRALAVELDGAHGLEGLEIELDTAPGALLATVILPQGRSPSDIWLTVSGGSGYRTSRADGSFSLPDLEPGIHQVSVTDSDDGHGEDRWIQMTHGPGSPDWLAQEFTFEAEVLTGETRAIELDLSRPPACRLQGAVSIGTRFLGTQDIREWAAGRSPSYQTPRLALDHGNPWEHDAAVTLDPEGRFLVGVAAPGTRRLFLELRFPELDLHWEVTDTVELVTGVREWNLALERGSLRLRPPDPERPIWSGPVLDWHAEGNLAIRVLYPLTEEADGSVLYHHVPAGTVTFSLERSGTKREYSCEIRAGETTELRLAE